MHDISSLSANAILRVLNARSFLILIALTFASSSGAEQLRFAPISYDEYKITGISRMSKNGSTQTQAFIATRNPRMGILVISDGQPDAIVNQASAGRFLECRPFPAVDKTKFIESMAPMVANMPLIETAARASEQTPDDAENLKYLRALSGFLQLAIDDPWYVCRK